MADDARPTAFVTGSDGFLGGALVKILVARGLQVLALTRSLETAQGVRRAGAMSVIGDLLTPGVWQDEASSDWVFHLPPTPSVHPFLTRVTAFPGLVYGNGSWFRERVMEPVVAGRRVLQLGAAGPLVSPIHVHDCVRALVHLAEHGERGGRYFLVNSEPARFNAFATTFARIANRPLSVWRVPAVAAPLVGGAHLAGHLQSDAVFSNIRLRGTGFQFHYVTLEQGLRQVWDSPHE